MARSISLVVVAIVFSIVAAQYPDEAEIRKMRETLISKLPLIDEEIGKLSAAAKVPAMKFRELILSPEQDLAKLEAITNGIVASLPADVLKELDTHRDAVMKKLGFSMHPH